MVDPASAGSKVHSSLFTALRSFALLAVAIFQARLQLATLELKEFGTFALRLTLFAFATVLAAAITVFFLLVYLVLLLRDQWWYVLPVICILCIAASFLLALWVRKTLGEFPGLLSQTLEELKRDTEFTKASLTRVQS